MLQHFILINHPHPLTGKAVNTLVKGLLARRMPKPYGDKKRPKVHDAPMNARELLRLAKLSEHELFEPVDFVPPTQANAQAFVQVIDRDIQHGSRTFLAVATRSRCSDTVNAQHTGRSGTKAGKNITARDVIPRFGELPVDETGSRHRSNRQCLPRKATTRTAVYRTPARTQHPPIHSFKRRSARSDRRALTHAGGTYEWSERWGLTA